MVAVPEATPAGVDVQLEQPSTEPQTIKYCVWLDVTARLSFQFTARLVIADAGGGAETGVTELLL
jgi:hypothetical protein